jgi:hypothetical protein
MPKNREVNETIAGSVVGLQALPGAPLQGVD